jgi:hypothetical protein
MGKRHQKTERVGLHRIALIIEDEFEWIFREQPIVDVGIDAFVEKSVNGQPTGKFLALQIKSGEGNVYKSKTKDEYIYYMSNIHYYYWTNLDMPILLLCYIPDKKKTFWAEVNNTNCIRTKEGWKISLPIKNIFNRACYNNVNRIITSGKGKTMSLTEVNNETIYNLGHLDLVNDSLRSLTFITNTYTSRLNTITLSLQSLIPEEDGLEKANKLEVQKHSIVTTFETLASRLYNEIHIFSKTYAKAISALKSNYVLLLSQGDKDFVRTELPSISKMVEAYTFAITSMESMRLPIENMKGDRILDSNISLDKAEIAVSTVVLNLTQAQTLGRKLIADTEAFIIKQNATT